MWTYFLIAGGICILEQHDGVGARLAGAGDTKGADAACSAIILHMKVKYKNVKLLSYHQRILGESQMKGILRTAKIRAAPDFVGATLHTAFRKVLRD
jgi:hypothetical protein